MENTNTTQPDESQFDDETLLVHAGHSVERCGCYVNPPVVRASTVLHESIAKLREREAARDRYEVNVPTYGIWGTTTHRVFYDAMSRLEGGAAGVWAFSTGLAACTMPILALAGAGDHVLITDSIYGPVRSFANNHLKRLGVEVQYFDHLIGGAIEELLKPNTRLVVMETPGSHSFELMDVPAIVAACRQKGVYTMIDNTWATPLFFKPLTIGVDVVVHAATKYIAGHSDLLM